MKKSILFFAAFLSSFLILNSPLVNAQTPVISTFSPASGAIGSSVTITGTGFSATAAQDIVFFGATKATVTAASAASLTVTVPVGATYQYISVTNLAVNLTAYSAKPFIVTLAGTIAFANKQDFTTGTNPESVSIGDIDGDGKPDLAVTNDNINTVSVLRNTSTSGTVSFAAKVDFTTGAFPFSVSIGDIDGDGKPDLAVANSGSNTVSVLRNFSTSGTVNFAAKVDYTTGIIPMSVSIGDIDGDGKPDLAVANKTSSTVSVLRNISTSGTVIFLSKVDFATDTYPYSVSIGDIDGDGKPDLAVANYNGSDKVSVFRNTSTSGTVSFDVKVDFFTGARPYSVNIGDIDGDGKPDLAVTNYYGNSVSVLRNISTAGTVSFSANVDFTTGVYPRSVSIGDIDGDGKPDLAVANWSSNTVLVLRNTSTSGTVSFLPKVDFTTGTNPSAVNIGDIDGDGKPDLVVANWGSNTVSVFRQIASITSLPAITSFSPASGCAGISSVVITGTNFTGATSVTFGGTNALSFTVNSATQITATIGSGATGTISVITAGGIGISTGTFTVNPLPTVGAVASPSTTVCAGTSVTLTGSGIATSYAWSGLVTNGVGFVPTATNTYTVTGTDGNSCSNTAVAIITVNPLPIVALQLFSPDTVCITTGTFTLTGGSPANGTFSGNGVSAGMFNPSIAGAGTHTVTYTYTDGNGCTDFASQTIFVDVCTGTAQYSNLTTQISVYPNPTNGEFTIQFPLNKGGQGVVEIYNTLGEKFFSAHINAEKSEIDLSNQPNGIYLLQLKSENGNLSKKIIINK